MGFLPFAFQVFLSDPGRSHTRHVLTLDSHYQSLPQDLWLAAPQMFALLPSALVSSLRFDCWEAMAKGQMSSSWWWKVEREHPGYCVGCFLLAVLAEGKMQPPKYSWGYFIVSCLELWSWAKLTYRQPGRVSWKLRVKLWPAGLQVTGSIQSTADKWDVRSQNVQALGIVGGTEKPHTRTETYILIYISIIVTNTTCEGGKCISRTTYVLPHASI